MRLKADIKIADVKVLVEEQGATFSQNVHDQVTHLVTTEKDVSKRSTKCTFEATSYWSLLYNLQPQFILLIFIIDEQARKFPNCKIVSFEWLQESVASRSLVSEKPYILKASSASESSSKVKEEEQTGKKRAIKTEDEDSSNKKQKDAQKAGSKSLTIPVDGIFYIQCPQYKSKRAS